MSVMLARSGTCGTTLDCIVAEQPRTPRTAQQETLVKRPRPCALIGIEQPQLDVALTSLWDAWPSCSRQLSTLLAVHAKRRGLVRASRPAQLRSSLYKENNFELGHSEAKDNLSRL